MEISNGNFALEGFRGINSTLLRTETAKARPVTPLILPVEKGGCELTTLKGEEGLAASTACSYHTVHSGTFIKSQRASTQEGALTRRNGRVFGVGRAPGIAR